MKLLLTSCLLIALGSNVAADSLCGVTDEDALFAQLKGRWDVTGRMAIDTNTSSFVDPFEATLEIGETGMTQLFMNEVWGDRVFIGADNGSYDVDQIDDFLEDTQAEWIADAVSNTPCGPEGLLQLSETIDDPNGDYSQITILPYFTDQMVVILEVEMVGEWGLAFITMAGLMTPQQDVEQSQ